jgi:hypothetical protein
MNTNTSESEKWNIQMQQGLIQKWIEETLRYMGQAQFDIHVGHMKVIIELSDGSKIWFFYSLNVSRNDIVGAVVTGMMDRVSDESK